MKKGKVITGITLAVALSVCGYFFSGASPQKSIGWETARVAKSTISNMVTATGTVEPITQVEVGTQVSGIINKIYVDYNSVVKKGELIAELEKTLLESEMTSKEADLQTSKTEFEYQQKNYNRTKLLYEKQLISDVEYETAVYQYDKSKSTYEKNQADLIKVRTNLNYAMIYSPIDGIILSRAVEEGQTVAASFSTPTLFTIAKDLTKMQVVADVDEADIGQVENGQRVAFTVDAYPDDLFEGEVMQVRLEATTTSNVVTYEVVINAPNPELKLKPGLTANITIYTLERKGILTVPSKALRFVPDQQVSGEQAKSGQDDKSKLSQKSVWVKKGMIITENPVTVGITNGLMTEVTGGLAEGDEVVVSMAAAGASVVVTENAVRGESSPFMPKRPGKK